MPNCLKTYYNSSDVSSSSRYCKKTYCCDDCEVSYSSKLGLRLHLKATHKEKLEGEIKEKRIINCIKCKKAMKNCRC